jgi:acid phosphatase type 7
MNRPFAKTSILASLVGAFAAQGLAAGTTNLVFTSDLHYGITRPRFHQAGSVDAQVVNRAMIRKMNGLSAQSIPADSGVRAGTVVGNVDYLVTTGDYANRQETGIQRDSLSWIQFLGDYTDSLTLQSRIGAKPFLLLSPGNHDISNAIGYTTPLVPLTDPTSMVGIHNRMIQPTTALSNATYNYATDKVNYSRDIAGVHFQFVNMWPDSANRVWMEADLATVPATTPVLIFTHSPPEVEAKNFSNPNGSRDINGTDLFQNLLAETFKDGAKTNDAAKIEMRGFAAFLKAHKNIRAYFNGHDNFNEFGTWTGPDNDVALPYFRVDSPMKGNVSKADETKLSFQLISIDSAAQKLTVREVLWNADSTKFAATSAWGLSKTLSLQINECIDTILLHANTLVDSNYTLPSWTLFLRARTKLVREGSEDAAYALKDAMAALQPKEIPYSVVTTINGDPATRMAFNWFGNANVSGGKVEIVSGRTTDAAAFAHPTLSVDATTSAYTTNYNIAANGLGILAGIVDNTKKTYAVNKALATGLTANTIYSYRVGKPGAWSLIGHFTTAKNDKSAYSFIYFTDPQAQTDAMFSISAKTMHTAVSTVPNARFILSCGDLVESTSPNAEWEYEQFFQTQQDIWSEYAFAPLEGNHDNSSNKNFTRHFNTTVTPFDSALSTVPGSVYSFVYGDVLFLAMSYESYNVPGYLDSLKTWMGRQVAAHPDTKWRVAFYHKTMYTGSQSHQSDADGRMVRDTMGPLFDSLHIDLALQGHDHVYEVIGPVKNKTLVAGAVTNQTTVTADARENVTGKLGGTFDVANGTMYFLNNSAGKKKYEPRSKAVMDSVEAGLGLTNYFGLFTGRFGQTGEPTFSEVKVSSDSINISTYTVNDAGAATLFDAFKVVKGTPTTSVRSTAGKSAIHAAFGAYGRNLVVGGNREGSEMTVDVVGLDGSHIATAMSRRESLSVPVPGLSKGLYLVSVRTLGGNQTFKLTNN